MGDYQAHQAAGCITAFDLVSDGHLRSDRSIGEVGDYRCSTGMDPDGTYFMEGNRGHTGVIIHRWDDMSSQKTIMWADAQSWGPDTWDTGTSHNRNAWSVNSYKWFCIHIGFGTRGVRGANQMLINWVDEERIVVSENADNSYQFDCAGDFWVGASTPQPPQITQHPQDQTVLVGEEAVFSVQATGSPPPTFQWQRDGSDVNGQTNSTLRFNAAGGDDGARFRCVATNSAGSDTSNEALLTVQSDVTPPTIASVSAPGDPNTVWVVFSEPLETNSASADANYGINNGITVSLAEQQADPATVKLTTATLSTGVTYTLTVNNVTDQAAPPNRIADNSTRDFTWEDQNLAPVVSAGPDLSTRVGEDLFLDGSASDDGLPGGALAISWSKVSGPGNVVFSPPDEAQTYAGFDAEGDYVVRLTADDGDKNASDDAAITVMPPPSITITRPAGGESFTAGDTEQIQWTTVGVDDVRMDFSADDGQTWITAAETVDTQSPDWGDYPWTVPNIPTTQARIQLTVYSDPFNATVSNQFTIVGSGNPQVTLTAPIGGETLDGNTIFDICFDAQDIDQVVLEVTLDGAAWDPIATVGVGDPEWGQFPWTVPNVSTTLAQVRVRAPSGNPSSTSDTFTIVPEAVDAGALEVTWLKFKGKLPSAAGDLASVQVAGNTFSVSDDGTFEAEVEVPAGAAKLTFEIQAGDGQTEYRRVVEVELKNAVPGLGVSAEEIKQFLNNQSGVLLWVDAAGRIQMLDFRGADPEVKTLGEQMDCLNPIISPDGTRVVYSQGPANG
ncbi:immunoglobulin domain-containing protein, partial [Myxococcota bacterium]